MAAFPVWMIIEIFLEPWKAISGAGKVQKNDQMPRKHEKPNEKDLTV